jgi:hypothetical protein
MTFDILVFALMAACDCLHCFQEFRQLIHEGLPFTTAGVSALIVLLLCFGAAYAPTPTCPERAVCYTPTCGCLTGNSCLRTINSNEFCWDGTVLPQGQVCPGYYMVEYSGAAPTLDTSNACNTLMCRGGGVCATVPKLRKLAQNVGGP